MDSTYTPDSEESGNDYWRQLPMYVVREYSDADLAWLMNMQHDEPDLPDDADDDL
jgi:hypothetical protein